MSWPAGYACAPGLGSVLGTYALRPLRWEDRERIRAWRNEQIAVLRQPAPLTSSDQDAYYRDVVAPQMAADAPPQVLLAMTEDDRLIGYGGIVHICWPDRRGEVSFLTDTARLDEVRFAADWQAYLSMMVPACRDVLRLHKLTTETYGFRTMLIPILEEHGFVLEGTLREHHRLDDAWVTSLAHGLILTG